MGSFTRSALAEKLGCEISERQWRRARSGQGNFQGQGGGRPTNKELVENIWAKNSVGVGQKLVQARATRDILEEGLAKGVARSSMYQHRPLSIFRSKITDLCPICSLGAGPQLTWHKDLAAGQAAAAKG